MPACSAQALGVNREALLNPLHEHFFPDSKHETLVEEFGWRDQRRLSGLELEHCGPSICKGSWGLCEDFWACTPGRTRACTQGEFALTQDVFIKAHALILDSSFVEKRLATAVPSVCE